MCPWKKEFFFPNPFSKKLKFVLEKKNTKKVITDLVIPPVIKVRNMKYMCSCAQRKILKS